MIVDPQVSGALFDFCGHLSTRPEPISVGASEDCPPLMDALSAWAAKRNLSLDQAEVERWHIMEPLPLLGYATTGQLLDELRARAEADGSINYRTVG